MTSASWGELSDSLAETAAAAERKAADIRVQLSAILDGVRQQAAIPRANPRC